MSKLTILPPVDQPTLEAQLTRWKTAEEGLERCTLFARVMQGLCLSELRTLIQRPGTRTDLTSPQTSERLNWAEYVRTNWGFSDDKARLLIQLGEAAKPRLRKLAEEAQAGLSAILDKPLASLSTVEMQSLESVTHKLTDGKTNRMIQEELGLFKGDEAKLKGGARTSNKPKGDGTLPEKAPIGWTQALWDRYRTLTTQESRDAFDCLYLPILKLSADFELYWGHLPDIERADIDGHLMDMRNKLKAVLAKAAK